MDGPIAAHINVEMSELKIGNVAPDSCVQLLGAALRGGLLIIAKKSAKEGNTLQEFVIVLQFCWKMKKVDKIGQCGFLQVYTKENPPIHINLRFLCVSIQRLNRKKSTIDNSNRFIYELEPIIIGQTLAIRASPLRHGHASHCN